MEPQNRHTLGRKVLSAFRSYMDHGDDARLIEAIASIKQDDKQGRSLWWRFFRTDTAATDVRNMRASMNGVPSSNRTYYIECMEMALKAPSEFLCHFS